MSQPHYCPVHEGPCDRVIPIDLDEDLDDESESEEVCPDCYVWVAKEEFELRRRKATE